MELKEFVAETLKQIVEGAVLAQTSVENSKATVNPKGLMVEKGAKVCGKGTTEVTGHAQMIDFDIALTEFEGGEGKGRIGVFFGPVGVGAQAKLELGNSTMNRAKFSIPLMLPINNEAR